MECRCADVAYSAGIFDGEGCISVSPYRTPDGRERFHCDIFLGMQSRSTLEFFQRTVGTGKIQRRKDIWMLSASGAKAAHVLKTVLPFLRTKKVEAQLFLEFAATFSARGPKPTPTAVVDRRRELSTRIRSLMRADAQTFHPNGVNSVDSRPGQAEGNTEPNAPSEQPVGAEAYRLGREDRTNNRPTSAPPAREEIVGSRR